MCRQHHWPFVRLDGTTSVKKRQTLVDQLGDRSRDTFIFLLRFGRCSDYCYLCFLVYFEFLDVQTLCIALFFLKSLNVFVGVLVTFRLMTMP